jgi:hypothetical protein
MSKINKQFDVLAVRGNEAETLHVEAVGTVPDGTRTDSLTGGRIEIIGRVVAADAAAALDLAIASIAKAEAA